MFSLLGYVIMGGDGAIGVLVDVLVLVVVVVLLVWVIKTFLGRP